MRWAGLWCLAGGWPSCLAGRTIVSSRQNHRFQQAERVRLADRCSVRKRGIRLDPRLLRGMAASATNGVLWCPPVGLLFSGVDSFCFFLIVRTQWAMASGGWSSSERKSEMDGAVSDVTGRLQPLRAVQHLRDAQLTPRGRLVFYTRPVDPSSIRNQFANSGAELDLFIHHPTASGVHGAAHEGCGWSGRG